MKFKLIYTRIGMNASIRNLIKSTLYFLTGLFLFTQMAIFSQPATAINFTTDISRPVDLLNYEVHGYTYDTLPIQGSNRNLNIRKNAASLTSEEVSRLVNAILTLKNSLTTARDGTSISIYDQFVATHLGTTDVTGRLGPDGNPFPNPAHGGSAFLPWHRKFLLEFEHLLQVVDPNVTLPYWDFTNPSETNIIFQNNFIGPNGGTGGVGGGIVQSGYFSTANQWLQRRDLSNNRWTGKSTATQPLVRYLQSTSNLVTPTKVNQTLALTSYSNFRWNLENLLHNSTHAWVGGSIKVVGTSPNDPIFWLLHANVDRLWAQWQINGHWGSDWYPASSQPYGNNLNDPMWPWDGGRMSAAADLQALIPALPSTQAQVHPSLRSVEFKLASSSEELMSDRAGHLYNPFVNDGHHNMADRMLDEDGVHHASENPSSWTS